VDVFRPGLLEPLELVLHARELLEEVIGRDGGGHDATT
jgi:hypothetical protein